MSNQFEQPEKPSDAGDLSNAAHGGPADSIIPQYRTAGVLLTPDEATLVKDLLALWEACNSEGFADSSIGAILDKAGEQESSVFDSLLFKVHPDAPNLCPKCHAGGERGHSAQNSVGECDYWLCPDCDHQWGHS